jgi:far upstream element-binding protein
MEDVSEELFIPNAYIGAVIGSAGATIASLQRDSRARIVVEADKNDPRKITVTGSVETVAVGSRMVHDVVDMEKARLERDPSVLGLATQQLMMSAVGTGQELMEVPNGKVGVVIGRGGENIRNVQERSGARVQIAKDDGTGLRTIFITGSEAQARLRSLAHA